ncbi:MFS transporter [Pseudaeromonas sp. ZJS20]|uniref:MFS transporter n=1 Tax=Pseudaeromonas aegiceratis TaxID=3153928 RepID=UPI00390CB5EE
MSSTLAATAASQGDTRYKVLGAISVSHFLNDLLQSLIIALYPLFKSNYDLSFTQIGLLSLAYQITASLLQPVVGFYTDKRPQPYSLVLGMGCTLSGLLLLANAASFPLLLLGAMVVGLGSSIFHPESSRVARMASGGRHGLAQSIFQVGGNGGTALGPLLAALIIIPHGQGSLAWFAVLALLAMAVLLKVGQWYSLQQRRQAGRTKPQGPALSRRRIAVTIGVLLLLITSKYFYLASLTNYYTFYLMDHFGLGMQDAQYHLFIFLFAVAAGTVLGGPIGDRIGRKQVIWFSILGVAPFTLLLPHVGLTATTALSFVIGFILASAFSAIIVYAQELLPGRVGTIAGLFFGFAFGIAGVGAAVLGHLADSHGIEYVYRLCAYLPLMGVITVLLPNLHAPRQR